MRVREPAPVHRYTLFLSSSDEVAARRLRQRIKHVVDDVICPTLVYEYPECRVSFFVDMWERTAAQRAQGNEPFVKRAKDSHLTLVLILDELRPGTAEEARQYDPSTGRFIQVDPIDPSADLLDPMGSTYSFARARPTTMSDPTGLTPNVVDPSETVAHFASSHSRRSSNPNAGDNCTDVPDSIGISVFTLIDFSPSCENHDICYRDWMSYRRDCDDDFEVDMRQQCRDQYQHTVIFPWDREGRKKCNDIAGVYYRGVQKLGNLSWPKKAYRYDRNALIGCPWTRKVRGGRRVDLDLCLPYVMDRSYPPYNPDRGTIVAQMAQEIGRILLPLP